MSYGEVRRGIITPSSIVAFQKDRASANEVSMTGLQELYKASKNLHCLAHTLTHVGDHMPALSAKRFTEDLCALCNSHGGNNKAASHWRKVFKSCWQPPGNTRWWAKLDLYKKMIDGFEDLVLFCMTAEEDGDIKRSLRMRRLAEVMESPKQRGMLRFQLAVLTIAGGHLYSATYNLEGDNCCSLVAYDTIKDCENWLTDHYDYLTYPGLKQEMNDCVSTLLNGCETFEELSGDALFDDLEVQAKTILKGAVDYFHGTIIVKLASDIELYKTCRYANPVAMRQAIGRPDTLVQFKRAAQDLNFFAVADVEQMGGEWHLYKRFVNEFEVLPSENTFNIQMERCTKFWSLYHVALPNLANFTRYCMTMTPSSAAAERVFSVLKNSFTIGQMRQSLEDYTEGSVMLQYNK